MFGFAGKLVGGVLDKIGLGFISPLVSMGINFMSGNYLGMIGDLQNLVSKFSNFSFLDKVSKFPPLGVFNGNNSNNSIMGRLLNTDFGGLRNFAQSNNLTKANAAFDILGEFAGASNRLQSVRVTSQYNYIAA